MHYTGRTYTQSAEDLVGFIQRTVNSIERRFGYHVVFIRLDGQTSLLESSKWSEWIDKSGLIVEVLAPDTHEQNSAAERARGVLTRRATKLRIEGNLPESL